jgi:GNAT superfamily N-acetyltransferase
VHIRQAAISDLELVVPLFDAYRQFYGQSSDPELARRFIHERLEAGEPIIFLAIDGVGSAVGFAQLFPSFSSVSAARILILNDLFVAPAGRRQGVGTLLLHAAEEFGRSVGAVRLTLSTEVTNLTAQSVYERDGWVRQTRYYSYDLALR